MSWLALSGSFEYICYGSTAIINIYPFIAGIDFRRQNLTSTDFRFWRPKSVPALKGLNWIAHYLQRTREMTSFRLTFNFWKSNLPYSKRPTREPPPPIILVASLNNNLHSFVLLGMSHCDCNILLIATSFWVVAPTNAIHVDTSNAIPVDISIH